MSHRRVKNIDFDDDDIDDGVPFPEIAFQLPPPPTYEQVLAEVKPGMREHVFRQVIIQAYATCRCFGSP